MRVMKPARHPLLVNAFLFIVSLIAGGCTAESHSESTASTSTASSGPAVPALVGEWLLNEGSGQVAHDRSGLGQDLIFGSGTDPSTLPTWSADGPSLSFNGGQLAWGHASAALKSPTITVAAEVKGTGPYPANVHIVDMSRARALGMYALVTAPPGGVGGIGFYIFDWKTTSKSTPRRLRPRRCGTASGTVSSALTT
jgi:hypothetical protein